MKEGLCIWGLSHCSFLLLQHFVNSSFLLGHTLSNRLHFRSTASLKHKPKDHPPKMSNLLWNPILITLKPIGADQNVEFSMKTLTFIFLNLESFFQCSININALHSSKSMKYTLLYILIHIYLLIYVSVLLEMLIFASNSDFCLLKKIKNYAKLIFFAISQPLSTIQSKFELASSKSQSGNILSVL